MINRNEQYIEGRYPVIEKPSWVKKWEDKQAKDFKKLYLSHILFISIVVILEATVFLLFKEYAWETTFVWWLMIIGLFAGLLSVVIFIIRYATYSEIVNPRCVPFVKFNNDVYAVFYSPKGFLLIKNDEVIKSNPFYLDKGSAYYARSSIMNYCIDGDRKIESFIDKKEKTVNLKIVSLRDN